MEWWLLLILTQASAETKKVKKCVWNRYVLSCAWLKENIENSLLYSLQTQSSEAKYRKPGNALVQKKILVILI